jgi:peptidoglycan hydrolase CwlO-like protein
MSIDARVMSQLEDFYEEALEMGMTEEKARDWAWDKHMDWVSGALMLKTKRMQRLQKMTEEEKKAMNEIDILKKNVADLQRQYQETLIKIKKLQEEK